MAPNRRPTSKMVSTIVVLKGDWIADSSNTEEVGQSLRFPSTHIWSSSSSEAKKLQLMVLESTSGPYAIEGLSHLLALEMPKLCEYVTLEGKASSTASHAGSLPSLVLPSNHVTEHATPTVIVTQLISRGASKWCQCIDHLGKVPFLSGFWDWSNYTAKMLSHHKMGALADAVFVFPDGEEFVKVGTFKVAAQMAIGVTYSLVPPILACIYRGLRQLTKVPEARYEASLPIVRQFHGILNAYQPWELEVTDCRAVLREQVMWCFTKKAASQRSLTILIDLLDSMDFNKDFQEDMSNCLMVVKCQIFIASVSIQFLKASEARNFIPSLMKSTIIRPQGKGKQLQALLSPSQKRNNAGDPSPSSKKQKCNRTPQRESDSLQHPLSMPVAQQTTNQVLYKEIFSSLELRGLPGDAEMISALDDFLETDTLEILGSLPSQIDGGVLSLNVSEQVTAEDGEVDSHDRQPSVKETVGLNPPTMTSSSPLKLKPTFSCITKHLEPISSQELVKLILFKAMRNYVQEEFSRGLQNGFFGLGQWWAERSFAILEALQLYFRMDVDSLLKTMDAYLSKKGISSNQIVHDSLSKEINELTKKKGSLESKIESLKKELESVEQQHGDVTSTLDLLLDKRQTAEEQLQSNQAKLIELENSKVVAVETVAEVERMRQDLEIEFEAIAKGTWFENNM
ncbi:hypothetical protein SLEP1_g54387 [Rubroshorea leprosula]|uniref:Uncharacterized protein n=1 Tax=Rubroshorea leprosula TaxID=152421 RepID=A0AAV5MC76_9ROSI|nr:hypothetical protein SLEP1_g54387 [Rubroshorea leprosula]